MPSSGLLRRGRGTPAPVAPTEELVITGPIDGCVTQYLAVVAVIVGQALLLRQASLLTYEAVVAAAFFTFVKLYEERVLAERYGDVYRRYRAQCRGGFAARRLDWRPAFDRLRAR